MNTQSIPVHIEIEPAYPVAIDLALAVPMCDLVPPTPETLALAEMNSRRALALAETLQRRACYASKSTPAELSQADRLLKTARRHLAYDRARLAEARAECYLDTLFAPMTHGAARSDTPGTDQ